jgi:formate hydrogenlyase transcriptional activator
MSETDATDPMARYSALLRVSRTLAMHRSNAELFRVLASELHKVVPFDYLALILHDAPSDEMRLVVLEPDNAPAPPFRTRPVDDHGPAAVAWLTQKPVVVPVPADGEVSPMFEFVRGLGGQITCFLPLTTVHGRIGVLAFASTRSTAYPDETVDFMEKVAAHVAVAVDNGINFDRAQQFAKELAYERDRLRLLLDVNNALVSELDYPSVFEALSQALQRLVDHDHASLCVLDRDMQVLRLQIIFDGRKGVSHPNVSLSIDSAPCGQTLRTARPAVYRRGEPGELTAAEAAVFGLEGLESVCCIPLVTRHGAIGTLNLGSRQKETFTASDVELLAQAGVQISIALENALAHQQLTERHDRLAEDNAYLSDEILVQHKFGEIVGSSRALRGVLTSVSTVAPTDATVLVLGETGTGKELVARAIHRLSTRRDKPFVRLSGAALPPGLLESELFGYEKGAFTGANSSRMGRIELANHGTLFLDEVGDIPADLQPKLLRVLQEREFERLGSTQTRHVDVRLIAATNRDLQAMVEEGIFRADLYYRLNVFPIKIPSLRDRRDDIPALARHFTERFARRLHRPTPSIPGPAMDALRNWDWPGNIRELENVIERAVILSPASDLRVPLEDLRRKDGRRAITGGGRTPGGPTLEESERETILRALRESGGIVAGPDGAAARLGVKRTTLQSMMRKLGIRRPSY